MEYSSIEKILLEITKGKGFYGFKHYPENHWVIFNCPFHQDSNPSLRINYDSGFWQCMSGCGSGNFISFVSRYLKISYIEADKYLIGRDIVFLPIESNTDKNESKLIKESDDGKSKLDFIQTFFPEQKFLFDFELFEQDIYDDIKDYWNKRKLTKEDYEIIKDKVYYDRTNRKIMFDCNYAVASKYLHNNAWGMEKGSNKNIALWKIIKGADIVILCEGIFDSLSLNRVFNIDKNKNIRELENNSISSNQNNHSQNNHSQNNHSQNNHSQNNHSHRKKQYDIIAILGNSLSKEKLDYINRYWDKIIVAFDNDDGGKYPLKTIYDSYKGNKRKTIYKLFYDGKDPNEMLIQDKTETLHIKSVKL